MNLAQAILPLLCIVLGWAMGRCSVIVDHEDQGRKVYDSTASQENVMVTDPWNQAVYGNGAESRSDVSKRRPTIVGDTQS